MVTGIILTASTSTSGNGFNLELLLSIVAIVIAVSTAIGEYIWNKHINVTNLESEFFKDIYFSYLMKEIPQARQYIRYSNNELADIDKLVDVLNRFRQDSLFFKYKDKSFYDKVKKEVQEIEEYLIQNEGYLETDAFLDFNSELNKRLENLYECIMQRYKGKKKVK